MSNRPNPTTLTVSSVTRITPNMHQIIFNGDDLSNTLLGMDGAHLKLEFESPSDSNRHLLRTYSIRKFDAYTNELIVQFAVHSPAGPGMQWVLNAKTGDTISMYGPGPKKIDTDNSGWYLFSADMSGLPAAIAAIEELPPNASGVALLEITSEKDVQNFNHPERLEIQWLIHPNPLTASNQQLAIIKSLNLPDNANVFVAGELSTIRKIKAYLNQIPTINRDNYYISSYWKIGANEEEHKQAKKTLAQ